MIIKPRIRGFICTTAHPEGCARHVQEQIDWIRGQRPVRGPKRVLVIGASTGYGLASRIAASFGAGADTIGVFFEKPASGVRTATAGWYNTVAFEKAARAAGYVAESVNGDAFSDALKAQTVELIGKTLQKLDLVIYSLASPRRTHPRTGERFSGVIKPVGAPYCNKTVDVQTGAVSHVTIDPATEEEIRHSAAVMGGEDWAMWTDALDGAGVLAEGFRTIAYSYIGPELTRPIYREGTIGKAKDHLEATAQELDARLRQRRGGRALVSVNKAVVTQSSAAIPVVPLYISVLYKVMKDRGLHEGCIEQIYRLFSDRLYAGTPPALDGAGRIRMDEFELQNDVQAQVQSIWEEIRTDNLETVSDIRGYREEFLKLFGFGAPGINYDVDVDPAVV